MKAKLFSQILVLSLFAISVSGQPVDKIDSLNKSKIKEKVEETTQELEKDVEKNSKNYENRLEYQNLQEANKEINRLRAKVERLQKRVKTLEAKLEEKNMKNSSKTYIEDNNNTIKNVSQKDESKRDKEFAEKQPRQSKGIAAFVGSIFR